MGRLKNKKSIPTFSKPRIEAGFQVAREWKTVSARDLREGDIIAGAGLVVAHSMVYDPYQVVVRAGVPTSKMWIYKPNDKVYAFVRKDN